MFVIRNDRCDTDFEKWEHILFIGFADFNENMHEIVMHCTRLKL